MCARTPVPRAGSVAAERVANVVTDLAGALGDLLARGLRALRNALAGSGRTAADGLAAVARRMSDLAAGLLHFGGGALLVIGIAFSRERGRGRDQERERESGDRSRGHGVLLEPT